MLMLMLMPMPMLMLMLMLMVMLMLMLMLPGMMLPDWLLSEGVEQEQHHLTDEEKIYFQAIRCVVTIVCGEKFVVLITELL